MNRVVSVALCLVLAVPLSAGASEPGAEERTWHRLVGILQYLEADYPAAIESQSQFELAEQKSFAAEAVDAAQGLGAAAAVFVPRVKAIQALVEDLVLAGGLARSPRHPPDLKLGEKLFQTNCAACHAADGSANLPIAATMEPAPAN